MRGDPRSRLRRLAGGLIHACASVLFGVAGHSAAGGGLPGPGALAGTAAVSAALSCAFAVRTGRRRFEAAVLGTGAQQVLLHLALHLLSRRAGHPGPHAGTGPERHASSAPAGTHEHAGLAAVTVTGMGAAHLLATLGTVLVLLRGERLLRRLVRLLAHALRLPPCAAVPCPETAPVPPPMGPPPLSFGARLARARTRRGPPPVVPAARPARVRPDRSRPDRVRAGRRPVHLSQRAASRRAGQGITHDHHGNRPGRGAA